MAAGITRDHPLLLRQESVDGHLGTHCLDDGGEDASAHARNSRPDQMS